MRPPELLRRPVVQDAGVALVLAVLSLLSLAQPPELLDVDPRTADPLGVALVVVASGSLVLRSRWPVVALVGSMGASLALSALGYSSGATAVAAILCLYSVAAVTPTPVSAPAGILSAAAVCAVLLTSPFDAGLGDWLSNLFIVATAWIIGRTVRERRHHLESERARAAAVLEAERADSRSRLAHERARTAREMQDLVAHHLAEVTVQVSAARRLVRSDPDAAASVLLEAEQASRAAMAEIRRVGGVLRDSRGPVELRPQPGLDDVDRLVRAERQGGLPVEFRPDGPLPDVPAGVGLTAYRIVEEALAQARRHDPDQPLLVSVGGDPQRLEVRVGYVEPHRLLWADDGRAEERTWQRLRARVETYGGELRWGTGRDGGFLVRAWLPLSGMPATA